MNQNTEKDKEGPGWHASDVIDGVRDIHCDCWLGFVNFLNGTLSDYHRYVYRGHASSKWALESTLDRLTSNTKTAKGIQKIVKRREDHLGNFKLATRGRRKYAIEMSDDEWWALGQHHGLATPLLDWTESPYVAAYFAFANEPKQRTSECVIYALSSVFVDQINRNKTSLKKSFWGALRLFRPKSDENIRLVSQRGLFSITDLAPSVEDWVGEHAINRETAALIRIFVPKTERDKALRNLNRMNVNHLSLFPDLYGASKYCNFQLTIDKY